MRSARRYALGLMATCAACAASGRPDGDGFAAHGDDAGLGANGSEGVSDGPHALGTIVLGETRVSSTGNSVPVISAAFVPDAKLSKSCTKTVDACELTQTPTCTTGTVQGCASDEVCAFDDSCVAKCIKACTKTCGAGEACAFTSDTASSPEGMTCTKKVRFDAGALAFDGTTQAITLFPPYVVTPTGNGAPFLAQTSIRVQATGGVSAGFEKFDDTFTTTTFLETDPPLREILPSDVLGGGSIPIGWVPGTDSILIDVTGLGGTIECKGDDKKGTFELPRKIIEAVRTASSSSSASSSLSISVTRERREVRKEKKTFGELSGGQKIQPTGWVELVTRSTESQSFAGCGSTMTFCAGACVDTRTDPRNCGGCGRNCSASAVCSSGVCTF